MPNNSLTSPPSSWINTSSRAVANASSSTSTAPPTTAPSVLQPKNSTVAASGPSTKSAPPSARTSSPPTSNPNSPGSSSNQEITNVMPLCYPLPHTGGLVIVLLYFTYKVCEGVLLERPRSFLHSIHLTPRVYPSR